MNGERRKLLKDNLIVLLSADYPSSIELIVTMDWAGTPNQPFVLSLNKKQIEGLAEYLSRNAKIQELWFERGPRGAIEIGNIIGTILDAYIILSHFHE